MFSKIFMPFVLCAFTANSCDFDTSEPRSSSGVRRATTKVVVNEKGHSVEQENVIHRLQMDNNPGSIKYLYVLSAMSGQVLIYSTVKGKVTSSGKRLSPRQINSRGDGQTHYCSGMNVDIGGEQYCTDEVIEDDGTYGNSVEYLYWFDV